MQARTVVIASGARYRRPDIANLATFEGAGISYWASPIEAKLCEGEEIALVGGGNSAGQAVVYLAARVKQLHLIIRGGSLDASMSRYLVERIAALPNVTLHSGTEIVSLEGDRAERPVRRHLPPARHRRRASLFLPPPVPVHRRRSQHRLAERLCRARRQGLHPHRQGRRRRTDDAAPRNEPPARVRGGRRALRLDQAGRRRRRRGSGGGGADPRGAGLAQNHFLPSEAGEVSAAYADGGVMSVGCCAHDPSARSAGTSPSRNPRRGGRRC